MGFQRSESYITGHGGCKLYLQIWKQKQSKGTIFITHGQGEHSSSYHRLINFFQDDVWDFVAWDLRGHGKSEGRRGFVEHFADYIFDFEIFTSQMFKAAQVNQNHRILLGHSMGGLIQLRGLTESPELQKQIHSQVLSSPALGLALPIPIWKTKGASFLKSTLPQVTLGNEILNEMLTRDLDVIREYEKDTLRHGKISPAAFLGFMESWDVVLPHAEKITLPTLVQIPEVDPVVNSTVTRHFYERLPASNKEIFVYPEGKHELYNDINRQTVYRDLKYFLDKSLENL